MVRAARRQDDGEYVTRGEFRAKTSALDEEVAELREKIASKPDEVTVTERITYTNRLCEMILDEIKPGWRNASS